MQEENMARKKQDSSENEVETANAPVPDEIGDETPGTADQPRAAEQPAKTWAKRPDPFGFESIRWPNGYTMRLMESDENREIFIRFGAGTKDDLPMNFEAIKKMLKNDYKMYWDVKVQGWAKGLKQGQTPLIREENKRTRAQVEEAFGRAVALEEEQRGLSLSESAREQNGRGR
jgi:hypothetical protein